MSEEENENTVLGKRSRSGQENPKAGDMELSQEPAREDDEDDDDDVGPMPMPDRKSTRLNSSHSGESRMPSSA